MTPQPPFRMLPSRRACLTRDGKFLVAGRASYVWERFLVNRASGVPGEYAIQREKGMPWHILKFRIEQAEDALLEWGGIFAHSKVLRARKLRAHRQSRGLPVL